MDWIEPMTADIVTTRENTLTLWVSHSCFRLTVYVRMYLCSKHDTQFLADLPGR